MNSKLVRLANKTEWQYYIGRAKAYDFYHCHSYNALDKAGEPVLFIVEDRSTDSFIAFPLVIRPIEGTSLFDCTSVYGFPGPISNKDPHCLSSELLQYFQDCLLAFFKEQNIIAAFSRLHPIIDQTLYLEGLGEVIFSNRTVAIDLTLAPEVQWQQYRRRFKNVINALHREGFTVRKAETDDQIDAFISIYQQTMNRVQAKPFYHFSKEYFYRLLHADDAPSLLLLAYKDDEIAAGAMFFMVNDIMQYHLSGTEEKYLHHSPMKLIIDEARKIGAGMGLQLLHLGGGANGSDDCSLFHFKAGFSHLRYEFKTWQMIVDGDGYDALVAATPSREETITTYFPVYRAYQ